MKLSTRYQSNAHGAGQIVVKGPNGQKTFPYDHGSRDQHVTAARLYAETIANLGSYSLTLQASNDSGTRRQYNIAP